MQEAVTNEANTNETRAEAEEHALIDNLALLKPGALPFPPKTESEVDDDDEWMRYNAKNTRIDMHVECWSRRLA
ncbi:MAG: hypothetical protein AAF645_06855 [Myxococcota bacterium]